MCWLCVCACMLVHPSWLIKINRTATDAKSIWWAAPTLFKFSCALTDLIQLVLHLLLNRVSEQHSVATHLLRGLAMPSKHPYKAVWRESAFRRTGTPKYTFLDMYLWSGKKSLEMQNIAEISEESRLKAYRKTLNQFQAFIVFEAENSSTHP